jgi:hypothetical protein
MAPQSHPLIQSTYLKGKHMPILLWLVGIPIPLIILILLLR